MSTSLWPRVQTRSVHVCFVRTLMDDAPKTHLPPQVGHDAPLVAHAFDAADSPRIAVASRSLTTADELRAYYSPLVSSAITVTAGPLSLPFQYVPPYQQAPFIAGELLSLPSMWTSNAMSGDLSISSLPLAFAHVSQPPPGLVDFSQARSASPKYVGDGCATHDTSCCSTTLGPRKRSFGVTYTEPFAQDSIHSTLAMFAGKDQSQEPQVFMCSLPTVLHHNDKIHVITKDGLMHSTRVLHLPLDVRQNQPCASSGTTSIALPTSIAQHGPHGTQLRDEIKGKGVDYLHCRLHGGIGTKSGKAFDNQPSRLNLPAVERDSFQDEEYTIKQHLALAKEIKTELTGGGEEAILEEIRVFANLFKEKRLNLGITQSQIEQDLASSDGPTYSQSAICRFEKLDMTPKSALKMKPVLERWLAVADQRYGLPPPMQLSPVSFNVSATCSANTDTPNSDASKKRKRRTCFLADALDILNKYFEKDTHPTGEAITLLADKLNYDREVIRVWFCNNDRATIGLCRPVAQDGIMRRHIRSVLWPGIFIYILAFRRQSLKHTLKKLKEK